MGLMQSYPTSGLVNEILFSTRLIQIDVFKKAHTDLSSIQRCSLLHNSQQPLHHFCSDSND